MSSEEEKVSLIVERDDLATFELREGREERAEKTTDGETKTGLEVVEDEFGGVGGWTSVALAALTKGEPMVSRFARRTRRGEKSRSET